MTQQCIACGGSGKNSKGGSCIPCAKAVKPGYVIIDDPIVPGKASPKQIRAAKKWMKETIAERKKPKKYYAAGFRVLKKMAYFAGPMHNVNELREYEPPHEDHPAYIVRIFQDDTIKPIAKWINGEWVRKKSK